jgi:hypothetical protein
MKQVTFTPEFVETIPSELKEGVLYISKKYGICIHLCACGCGVKTPLPIKGEGIECDEIHQPWTITEVDGKVSLTPSIGNFSGEDPYHAHYVITDNIATFA